MKRMILVWLAMGMSLTAMAQQKFPRTMRVFYEGHVLYAREVTRIDSIDFIVDYTEDLGGGVTLLMKPVEGGTFTMGCTSEQGSDCSNSESPAHKVTVSGFYMGETEITQSQWEKVMGTTIYQQRDKANTSWPMLGVGSDYPMYYVSWEDAVAFCAKLSELTGRTYRLPTEAEWEYAARGGANPDGTKYAGSNMIGEVAWYMGNSSSKTHPVGQKLANGLGLYDMSGNVWEWCSDWYSDWSYSSGDAANPTGPASGSSRVFRGGSWLGDATGCRVSNRSDSAPGGAYYFLGFRVVREL